jgi:flagellar basal-body rod protein FlgF
MSDGIYSALSGAIAQERTLGVVANNVANTNTTGYKGDKTIFAEVMNKVKSALPVAPSLRYGTVAQLSMDKEAGSLRQTGRPLDVALQGDGYFTLDTANGERYTRAGAFMLDRDGVLRTPGGLAVLQDTGSPSRPTDKIIVPPTARELSISPDGSLSADGQVIGKLRLVRFEGTDPVLREGLTLFAAQNGATPLPIDPTTSVEQGFLESANVNAVTGMNELITVHRSFEALQKVIETFRELDDRTARDVAGKV